tara:strand:- start:1171 stop:1425 length:255 start_codon:yes stop_codon:yes gene_type:complete
MRKTKMFNVYTAISLETKVKKAVENHMDEYSDWKLHNFDWFLRCPCGVDSDFEVEHIQVEMRVSFPSNKRKEKRTENWSLTVDL